LAKSACEGSPGLGGLHSVLTTTWPIVLGLHVHRKLTQESCGERLAEAGNQEVTAADHHLANRAGAALAQDIDKREL
jgi:hypothetical protein